MLERRLDPCMSEVFPWADLPAAHTKMLRNEHKPGNMSVLVQAPTDGIVQAVAGKTFDYLRAGRPVLAIGPDGDNLDLVRRHAWRHECPADTPETIAAMGDKTEARQAMIAAGACQ